MVPMKIAVLYGSETGNAYNFAAILSNRLHRFHFPHVLTSLGDYNARDILNCRYLIIICSTTGQGALPRNARESSQGDISGTLWTHLKKKNLPSDFLSHLNVAFLGLGDTSYTRFNFAIRKLHTRIVSQLGGVEIFPRLEADEMGLAGSNSGTGNGVDDVYFEFERRVLGFLTGKFPTRMVNGKQVKREAIADDVYLKPKYWLEFTEDQADYNEDITFIEDENVKYGSVVMNKIITAENHFQDVRQFVFKTQSGEEYYPGDTASLYPFNTDENVQAFIDAQPHWKEISDKPLKLVGEIDTRRFKDGGLVSPITLRNLLKYHCDIMSIPNKSFFMKIWTFAIDGERLSDGSSQLSQQREKLMQFGLSEDMQDLYDYCNRPRRSILEVIQDFESLKLPWKFLLDYIPEIKPRFFSISGKPCDNNLELTIAVVKYKTILRRIRTGLCTNYISGLENGEIIRYKIQHNSLFPKSLNVPIIMISPGVGLAPMKCLIHSSLFQDMHLFFGNRYKHKDFLYEDQLMKWHQTGRIKLFCCFSRDPDNSSGLKYVQDVIWKYGKEVAELIVAQNAIVYICGSSGKMPVQVRLTIVELLKKWGGFSNDKEAEIYIKDMENSDRYLQETW
ncbi:NAPDH-dependent diflavin reductase Ecym_7455 [Eremothecium cymbalariae DBVPG|uniref:NADPH-dependent diflavin oxidoreductase 1 n=1 Tax=Eremothecium cymbalariae (strain CBS 270.75 / DBVPG 7215 / KCTC 17166 / NRRL Y-17582) TaxID=931890 RepID=G8JWQ9_ERECY|nr:hypothetical protein Ecym_7455 [Eremothecium cymbalariae DBVPG\